MDPHQRQQFDFLLQTATERFVARLELLEPLQGLDQGARSQAVGTAAT